MKRKLGALLCVSIVALCGGLAGCSEPQSNNDADTQMESINLWIGPQAADNNDKEHWNEILQDFEKEHNVSVNVKIVPWDSYETSFLTGITSGDGPDVGYMYTEMIGDYIEKNQIVDLSDFVSDEQKNNFNFLDQTKVNGKQYSIPFVVGGARILVYNKDLFAQAGVEPPHTWDDFIDVGKKLKTAGIQPFIAEWGNPDNGMMAGHFYPFLWQAGGDLFDQDGNPTLDSTQAIQAAQFILNLKNSGVLPENVTGVTDQQTSDLFEKGKVAMTITSDQSTPKFDQAGINWDYITSLKGPKQEGTFIATDSLAVFKTCEDQQLCYDLISYLTSGTQMAQFHKFASFPPIGKDENSTYSEKLQKIYTDEADILHSLPVRAGAAPVYDSLYENLQAMLMGDKTPEQAMQDAQKAAVDAVS